MNSLPGVHQGKCLPANSAHKENARYFLHSHLNGKKFPAIPVFRKELLNFNQRGKECRNAFPDRGKMHFKDKVRLKPLLLKYFGTFLKFS